MRYLFIIIVTVFSASLSYAQTYEIFQDPEETGVQKTRNIKESDIVDSVAEKIKRIKRVSVTIGKSNRMGLDNLLGLSRVHAFPIIKRYDHRTLKEHEPYPYIREVIEITNVTRWNYPATMYIFIDSAYKVCRMNYVLATPDGMSPDSAHRIMEQLRKDHEGMDYVPDQEWETAGWHDNTKTAIYMWQKNIPKVRPAYILTLKSYMDDHLLPYTKENGWPKDGIFTSILQPIVK